MVDMATENDFCSEFSRKNSNTPRNSRNEKCVNRKLGGKRWQTVYLLPFPTLMANVYRRPSFDFYIDLNFSKSIFSFFVGHIFKLSRLKCDKTWRLRILILG